MRRGAGPGQIAVLRFLRGKCDPQTLTEISDAAGATREGAYLVVRSLIDLGLVESFRDGHGTGRPYTHAITAAGIVWFDRQIAARAEEIGADHLAVLRRIAEAGGRLRIMTLSEMIGADHRTVRRSVRVLEAQALVRRHRVDRVAAWGPGEVEVEITASGRMRAGADRRAA